MKKLLMSMSVVLVLVSVAALAQSRVTADQGRPGNQGPWPVTTTGSSNPADGGANTAAPYMCNIGSPNKLTIVDGGGTITVPATAQAFRVYTEVCNSPLNSAGTVLVCRADGTAPASATITAVGDVLNLGDCKTYTVSMARNILCLANASAAYVNTYECF